MAAWSELEMRLAAMCAERGSVLIREMRKSYYRGPRYTPNRWELEAAARVDAAEQAAQSSVPYHHPPPPSILVADRRANAALHEAAHVVISVAVGQPVNEVEIGEDGGGSTWHVPEHKRGKKSARPVAVYSGEIERAVARNAFFDHCVILLAGDAVQRRAGDSSEHRKINCQADRDEIVKLIMSTTEDEEEALEFLDEVNRRTEELVDQHWDAIKDLTLAIFDRRRLDADQIARVLKPHGLTVKSDRAAPKPKLREKTYPVGEEPIIRDLQRKDGWISAVPSPKRRGHAPHV